jgi:cytochrome c
MSSREKRAGIFREAGVLGLVVVVAFMLSACAKDVEINGGVDGMPEPRPYPASMVQAGRSLIAAYGCGSCHSVPGVPGADAMAAPPLDQFYQRSYIAGKLPNIEENLIRWIQDPQAIVPGNAMPNLGVTASEARDIAAYLYHQPTLGDLVSR